MNSSQPSGSILRNIASGYGKLARSAGLFLAAGVVTVAAAAAIVWPLWALAVNRTDAFNLVFLSALGLCVVLGVVFSVRRKLASGVKPGVLARKALAIAALALVWLVLAISLYLVFVFASRGIIAGAALAALAFIALAGFLYSRRKRA